MTTQSRVMKFDPQTGAQRPYPSEAVQYRTLHHGPAWLYNPWTGEPRSAAEVGADMEGKNLRTVVPSFKLGDLTAVPFTATEGEETTGL